jgi:hypothetical protein
MDVMKGDCACMDTDDDDEEEEEGQEAEQDELVYEVGITTAGWFCEKSPNCIYSFWPTKLVELWICRSQTTPNNKIRVICSVNPSSSSSSMDPQTGFDRLGL